MSILIDVLLYLGVFSLVIGGFALVVVIASSLFSAIIFCALLAWVGTLSG
jgi:hypothetical protein